MYKLFVIAKNNMKKQRGDMITFFILTFIASFLLFDAISSLIGVGEVMDTRFNEVFGVHFMLISGDSEEEKECIRKAVSEHYAIIGYESVPCLRVIADHKHTNETEYNQYYFIMQSFNAETKYMDIVEDGISYREDDILLPMFLINTYALNDKMQIKIGDNEYTFNVAGYVEDPYFSSTINLTYYYVYISDEMMEKMADDNPGLVARSIKSMGYMDESKQYGGYSTMAMEKEITDRYKELLKPYAAENPDKNYDSYMSMNWEAVRGGATFIPLILMSIILVFAVIIIIIAITIISFSVKNFIQRNMKNTGILEASGYTVRELRAALSFQIILVSLAGAVIGTVVAIASFDIFGNLISLAIGLKWCLPINLKAAAVTVIVPVLVIFIVSRLTSLAYKKITVLDALRGGINTHNFRKNRFTFEKTPLPIPAVVSLKETFGSIGRNIIMVLIVSILTMSVLIGFGMYENFGAHPKRLMDMMGFENGTLTVTTTEDIDEDLRQVKGVKNVLPLFGLDLTVSKGDYDQSIFTYILDVDYTTNAIILEGRMPKHDNEIMMTTGAAQDVGVGLGSTVDIEYAGNKETYIITGIYQRMDRMGRTIYMTEEGGKKLIPGKPAIQYYVTGEDGVSYETLKSEIEKLEKNYDTEFDYVDLQKQLDGTMGIVSFAMKVLCIVITIVTILVVIFVESLIIRAKIVREWRGMGISKALGMTSWQLIAQIMLSNVPAIILGVLIGTAASPFCGKRMTILVFKIFGIQHIEFNISFLWMLVSAVGILVVALLASGISGLKVRRLRPVEMITED